MAANFHPSAIQRWVERLCRIDHPALASLAHASGTKLRPRSLPHIGAVYCFWWTGDLDRLRAPDCSRSLILKGPGGRDIPVEISDAWLGLQADQPVPLYVGKTSNLSKRVRGHLYLGKPRAIAVGDGVRKQKAPTTTCQLRAGVDHLFPAVADTRPLVLENVGLSYVTLDGDDHAANRFYLEDLAIGLMRPPINMDVER